MKVDEKLSGLTRNLSLALNNMGANLGTRITVELEERKAQLFATNDRIDDMMKTMEELEMRDDPVIQRSVDAPSKDGWVPQHMVLG